MLNKCCIVIALFSIISSCFQTISEDSDFFSCWRKWVSYKIICFLSQHRNLCIADAFVSQRTKLYVAVVFRFQRTIGQAHPKIYNFLKLKNVEQTSCEVSVLS